MLIRKLIAPSILSADFVNLEREVKDVQKAGADVIHIDVMDGHFVPNITIGPLVVKALRRITKLPLDVHLMIENPEKYIEDFAKAGADWISVHVEKAVHLDRTLALIRDCKAKVGVAINPATSLSTLDWVLDQLDFVLLMTVNPGFGGQSFVPYCKEKIKTLREKIDSQKLETFIEIDGGVKVSNAAELSRCGADVFVAGSAIFEAENYKKVIADFRKMIL